MNKEKIEFIAGLLSNKGIKESHKEKIFHLASREFQQEIDSIWKEINNLKIKNIQAKLKTPNEFKPLEVAYHDPKQTVKFLYRFSKEDQFKWFTHLEPPPEVIFKEYYEESKKQFGDLEQLRINPKTWKKVHNFLYGSKDSGYPNTWESYDGQIIQVGWHSIINRCQEGLLPENLQIDNLKNENYTSMNFGELMILFRHSIEARTDKGNLIFDLIIKNLIRKMELRDRFDINIREGLTVQFYADIYLLTSAIEKVLNWCKEYIRYSNKLEIVMNSLDKYFEFTIFHKGSKIDKEPQSDKLNGLAGNLIEVRKDLFCNCDFKIEADFDTGDSYCLIYLDAEINQLNRSAKIKQIGPIGGVKYILNICKTISIQ